MKKVIVFILTLSLLLSSVPYTGAVEETEAQYGSISVEFSDAYGSIEQIDVMVHDDHVYAEAFSLSERLGYNCEQIDNIVSVYGATDLFNSAVPSLAVHFSIGDTVVSYNPLFGMEEEYTAPYPCIQNDRGIWLPLHYTITILGGSCNIFDNVLIVQMPYENVLSIAAKIVTNASLLSFDWSDFGYSETTTNVTNGAGRIVTLFSGLLEFDGSAWTSFVDWNAFDKKFGSTFAAMFCTNSDDEFQESIEEIERLNEVFHPDGTIGSFFRNEKIHIDSDVNAWRTICEEKLKMLKDGTGTATQYNMAYQQYERAMDEQELFAITGENVIAIQDGLSTATTVLDLAAKIGTAVSYFSEFYQRDHFQFLVLKHYLYTRVSTDEISDAAIGSMKEYVDSMDNGALYYAASRYIEDHLLEEIVDGIGLDALMGAPANIALLAWDFMSENIPFYSEGLKDVESREISNYAQKVQGDAFVNISRLLASMKANSNKLSQVECVQLAEHCYVYLKACYIARSSALEAIGDIPAETKKQIQEKLDIESDMNQRIAGYLAILSKASADNDCYILGCLPENNDEYLKEYSDSVLLSIIKQNNTSGDLSQYYANILKNAMINSEYANPDHWYKDYFRGLLYDVNGDGIEDLLLEYVENYTLLCEIWTVIKDEPKCIFKDSLDAFAGAGIDFHLTLSKSNGVPYLSLKGTHGETFESYEYVYIYELGEQRYEQKHVLQTYYCHIASDGSYSDVPTKIEYTIDGNEANETDFLALIGEDIATLLQERLTSGRVDGSEDWQTLLQSLTGEIIVQNPPIPEESKTTSGISAKDAQITLQDLIGEWKIDTELTMEANDESMTAMFGRPYNDGMVFGENGKFKYFITYHGGEGSYQLFDGYIDYSMIDWYEETENGHLRVQEINNTLYLVQEIVGNIVYWMKA